MKATKIIIASLLVIAAVAYAKKEPVKFLPGQLEGFTKPADAKYTVVTNEVGVIEVDFADSLGEKGQVQFTMANGENIYIKAAKGKAIAQKGGKVAGTIGTVESGFNGVALKLKGITVGTVVATGVKSAQVANITGGVDAGNYGKGTALKAAKGKVDGYLKGSFKSVQANEFGKDVDGLGITTPKKVNFKAKVDGGQIKVSKDLEGKYKAKHVSIVPVDPNPTPAE